MAVIASYQRDENYGLLGPQMAATIIEAKTPCKCIVIAVSRDDDKAALKKALARYFGSQTAVIGFTSLSGRPDLFDLAGELKSAGAITILAGPQAGVDFAGEIGWVDHPNRFRGLADQFSFALQGPAEQILPLFKHIGQKEWQRISGLVYRDSHGRIVQNPAAPWNETYLSNVGWSNLYTIAGNELTPLLVGMGQVLQNIGCPHAARKSEIELDYPASLSESQGKKVKLRLRGCSFCDVAADKGFHGRLSSDAVISQIECLPQGGDDRKIPFELINENPLPWLADLLNGVRQRNIRIRQVNLTLRADWLASGAKKLQAALQAARDMDTAILLSSIGFESFNDTILHNLNKGVTKAKNLEAIGLVRKLKQEFPRHLGYSSREGAVHGFIHPTPWDTKETESTNKTTIHLYGLQNDILPPHSTPLIVHHASALGDWIREIERRENISFRRHGSIVAWWEPPSRN